LALVNRRKMASVVAVPVRIAVAYLIIWSYWEAIRSQRKRAKLHLMQHSAGRGNWRFRRPVPCSPKLGSVSQRT
jgi:hypothetical protein